MKTSPRRCRLTVRFPFGRQPVNEPTPHTKHSNDYQQFQRRLDGSNLDRQKTETFDMDPEWKQVYNPPRIIPWPPWGSITTKIVQKKKVKFRRFRAKEGRGPPSSRFFSSAKKCDLYRTARSTGQPGDPHGSLAFRRFTNSAWRKLGDSSAGRTRHASIYFLVKACGIFSLREKKNPDKSGS